MEDIKKRPADWKLGYAEQALKNIKNLIRELYIPQSHNRDLINRIEGVTDRALEKIK